MSAIYLEFFSIDGDFCLTSIETLIALFTMKFCDSAIKITLVRTEKKPEIRGYLVKISDFTYNILEIFDIPIIAGSCELPNLTLNESSCVAGLCACLRQLIKSSISINPNHHCRILLGFKDSCLMAPSESSVWTRFCEVDLISTLKHLNNDNLNSTELPTTLARFEMHMSQPVRLHNIYKYTMSKKYSSNGIVSQERTIPEHLFSESSTMTLADIIIFVCIHVFLNLLPKNQVFKILPLTAQWYKRMIINEIIINCLTSLPQEISQDFPTVYSLPTILDQSLYKSDAKRYKPRNRIFTRQDDIENSLKIIKTSEINLGLNNETFEIDNRLDWSKIPYEAKPEGGSLPPTRLKRKYQQLSNLCEPVLQLAKPNDIIVDFCSGSGHLGILVAYLRPDCTIILLENKEESLNRSKERVKKLGLINIRFYQCNLDYFKGNFNIGMSLHACGVATDLVIQHCICRNAIIISCPCCYGSVKDCHHITYPRSKIFQNIIKLRDYLVLGHAADQTHDEKNSKTKQGYICMNIIDTDRKLQAEEFGYKIYLMKLIPETCTPKNHLLIGIPKESKFY